MPELVRVTVNLTPRAMDSLTRLTDTESKTDAINRAVQLYDLVRGLLDTGGTLHVTHADGTRERLHIL